MGAPSFNKPHFVVQSFVCFWNKWLALTKRLLLVFNVEDSCKVIETLLSVIIPTFRTSDHEFLPPSLDSVFRLSESLRRVA
jgi:hypothetical protein